ncbi:MAG: serine/threonine protein kinase [Sandaracinaceae bacterium]|nr:serine/threonine protein kinase [Sandaracinaceae bacterium]
MPLSVGAVIAGKYRLERLLGEGGMGRVFVANNERLDKRVALKVLSEAAATSPDAAARFTREAIAASRVNHPGIVEIYDADVHEGQPWIAMELLAGESLGERLERGPLSVEEALAVAIEALSVLELVHRAGIVHRDLKPDNLFLHVQGDGRRVVKVLDFGIAKVHGGELGSDTRTGMAMGTPLYLAPEQARNAKDVDARADLYAVGAILYHALTGKHPYHVESFGDLVAQMFTVGPRSLSLDAPHLPPSLCAVVDACLSVERDRRPRSARELREALEGMRSGARSAPLAVTAPMVAPPAPALVPTHAWGPPPPHGVPAFVPVAAPRARGALIAVLAVVGLVAGMGMAATVAVVALEPGAPPPRAAAERPPPVRREPEPAAERAPEATLGAVEIETDLERGILFVNGAPRGAIADTRRVALPHGAHQLEVRDGEERLAGPESVLVADDGVVVVVTLRRPHTAADEPQVEASSASPSAASDPQADARRCVLRGDNACVIRLLSPPGRANDAASLAMLIEAYRAQGQTREAERAMELFVRRYPTHERARRYREILQMQRGGSGGGRRDVMPSNPF